MKQSDSETAITIGAAALGKITDNAEQMLEELYDQYAQSLFRYAVSLLGSPDDAEDVVQDVFVRIAREHKRVMGIRNLKAYLFTATRNNAYSRLRQRRNHVELTDDAASALETCEHTEASVDSVLLSRAFEMLPVEQREVLALKVYEQMTFDEIARTIGVSINTVSSRYRYAIAKLRLALEGDDHGR